MEKEIAGKILNFLRESTKKKTEKDVESNLALSSASSSRTTESGTEAHSDASQLSENETEASESFSRGSIYFSLDFSFTQYLSQSVDRFSGVSISQYKERNHAILKKRKANSKRYFIFVLW